jgi:hypothetical protein
VCSRELRIRSSSDSDDLVPLFTWEICGTKTATNIKPGSQMTLECGFGRRMLSYRLNVGVGSYNHKLTLDSGTAVAFS